MTHYDVSYKGMSRAEADTKAIKDIQEYLTPKQWEIFMGMVANPDTTIHTLNMSFGFVGVSGYPFHAFCRKYMFDKYVEWMTTGEDAVKLDAEGFTIKDPNEPEPLTMRQVEDIIKDEGGKIESGINWNHAIFNDDEQGRKTFAKVAKYVEHRGYSAAMPDSPNLNLHKGGFRYR